MSKSEDQLGTAGAITNLVFDENNQGRRSWRFCISSTPHSQVVFFQ